MFWEGVVVFSVVVFINVASINCNATRQVEGEFILLLNTLFFSRRRNLYDFEF